LGGLEIEPSHTQKIKSGYTKDAGSKTPRSNRFLFHPLGIAFHQAPFAATKAFCANPLGRFHAETSRANAIHPEGFGLGFEQGVSSLLTLNESKLGYGFVSGGEEC
jgi:hypothetical protein